MSTILILKLTFYFYFLYNSNRETQGIPKTTKEGLHPMKPFDTIDFNHLSKTNARSILELPDEALPDLLKTAYELRKKHKGRLVSIQLLTNARSGDCTQNCAYCAQSQVSKADIPRYRQISGEKLLENGKLVLEKKLSRHCIGLSGIRFQDSEIEDFAREIKKLKEQSPTPVCCYIGLLTEEQARKLKCAGVDRINHNLNTSRRFYPNICTTHTYQERIANLQMLKNLGFELCCGGIIGLGEETGDVADMLLEIRKLKPQAVPVNFLIPIEGTPLAHTDVSHLTPEYCLKVLCLARLLNPYADIRCAAGREVYLKGREKELFCAVDSIFASGYLTAGGQGIDDTIRAVLEAGFEYCVEG